MKKLSILIPTYNRKCYLLHGLQTVATQIRSLSEPEEVSVIVSDNASDDGTWEALAEFAELHADLDICLRRQTTNVGLESNAVALLESASAEWALYCGDDDLLPEGYLARILELAKDDANACVIPGITAVDGKGFSQPSRGDVNNGPQEIAYHPSWRSSGVLAAYGHQLSGLAFRREGTLAAYLDQEELRNIYPFVFFVGFNALRGVSWFVPRFQVLVLEGQKKDWSYDSSGLLREILANFQALYPQSSWPRAFAEISLIARQGWRLIGAADTRRAFAGFKDLFVSDRITVQTRLLLPCLYAWQWMRIFVPQCGRQSVQGIRRIWE